MTDNETRLLQQLAKGTVASDQLGEALDLDRGALSTALWGLRGRELVEFDTMKLTAKGKRQAALAAVEAQRQAPRRPATDGAQEGAAIQEAARPAPDPVDVVQEVDEEGAARVVARPSAPRPAARPAPVGGPPAGFTRTRSPGELVRRIATELALADPRQTMLTMVKEWPEASRRIEALARRRGVTLHSLMAEAIAAGTDAIEAAIDHGE